MTERLKLTKPITPFVITQRFGDDFTCIDVATYTKCITRDPNETCPIGYESLYALAGLKGHNGIDFLAVDNQPVYAATDGKIVELSSESERGIGVEIVSKGRFLLDGIPRTYRVKTRYWHLASYTVSREQKVKAGELIGYADNTGLSSGTHLHFEVKPAQWRLSGGFKNILQDNGYFGAINPEPYF